MTILSFGASTFFDEDQLSDSSCFLIRENCHLRDRMTTTGFRGTLFDTHGTPPIIDGSKKLALMSHDYPVLVGYSTSHVPMVKPTQDRRGGHASYPPGRRAEIGASFFSDRCVRRCCSLKITMRSTQSCRIDPISLPVSPFGSGIDPKSGSLAGGSLAHSALWRTSDSARKIPSDRYWQGAPASATYGAEH